MSSSTTDLLQQRDALIEQIRTLQDFRRGTVTLYTRTCGKPTCRCATDDSAKHEQYLWTASIDGKTQSKHLRAGTEVAKYLDETERFRTFKQLVEQLTLVCERIANTHPPAPMDDADALEALKKKLRTRLSRPRKRKSAV
jgi:hypothetical protein